VRPAVAVRGQIPGSSGIHQDYCEEFPICAAGFHPYLEDAVHVRRLKDIALTYASHYSTVLIVGYALRLPQELQPFVVSFRLPLPTPEELRGIVLDVAGDWAPSMAIGTFKPPTKPLTCWCEPGRADDHGRAAARRESHQQQRRDFRVGHARRHARQI